MISSNKFFHFSSNQDSKIPKVSIQVNHKSNGSIHTQITTTTASTSQGSNNIKLQDAFPALGETSKKEINKPPEWIAVKSKKSSEKPSKVAPAPELPPNNLNQFPVLKKGEMKIENPLLCVMNKFPIFWLLEISKKFHKHE